MTRDAAAFTLTAGGGRGATLSGPGPSPPASKYGGKPRKVFGSHHILSFPAGKDIPI